MQSNDAAHNIWHVDCVVQNSKKIIEKVPCCADVVVLAALTHDIAPRSLNKDYALAPNESARLSRQILRELNVPGDTIEAVEACIVTSSWEHAVQGGHPVSLESTFCGTLIFSRPLERMGLPGSLHLQDR